MCDGRLLDSDSHASPPPPSALSEYIDSLLRRLFSPPRSSFSMPYGYSTLHPAICSSEVPLLLLLQGPGFVLNAAVAGGAPAVRRRHVATQQENRGADGHAADR